MKIEIKGLGDVKRKLNGLSQKAEALQGQRGVSFAELFDDNFMQKYTSCSSMQELMDGSGFNVETKDDFAKIPDEEWDQYIQKVTQFSSWSAMMDTAIKEYTIKKLGL